MLTEGMMIHRHRDDGSAHTLTILSLHENRRFVGSIDTFNAHALPEWAACSELEEELRQGDAEVVKEDPFAKWRDPKYDDPRHQDADKWMRQRKKRDRAWQVIEPLIDDPCLYDRHRRGRLIAARARQCGVHKKYVYQKLRRYLQAGKFKNALWPQHCRAGRRKGTPADPPEAPLPKKLRKLTEQVKCRDGNTRAFGGLYALFVWCIRECYDKKPNLSLKDALFRLWIRSFSAGRRIEDGTEIPILKPPSQRPKLEQLRYFYYRYWPRSESKRKRLGSEEYERTKRAINKGTSRMAAGPGALLQGDGTPADLILVSSLRRTIVIGKVVVYFFTDHFSHLICGFSIGTRKESYISVMAALEHVTSDKVAYAKQHGLAITKEKWPVEHLPKGLLVDRGCLGKWKGSHLVNALGIKLQNTVRHRGDLKGLSEHLLLRIKNRVIKNLPGCTARKEYGEGRQPHRMAKVTIDDLTKFILYEILRHNNRLMRKYKRSKAMIRDGVLPIPSHLWAWGCRNRLGQLRKMDPNVLRLNLLPMDEGTVAADGLHFKQRLYWCPDELCARARQEGRFKVWVSHDDRALEMAYMRDPRNDESLIACTMAKGDRACATSYSDEHEAITKEEKEMLAAAAATDDQEEVRKIARDKRLLDEVKARHRVDRKSGTKKRNDISRIEEAKQAEQDRNDRRDAWRFGKTVAESCVPTDPAPDAEDPYWTAIEASKQRRHR